MADRQHVLRFTVRGADWGDVEKQAAGVIRQYTAVSRRGPHAGSDDAVLGNARFSARPVSDRPRVWEADVEVTV